MADWREVCHHCGRCNGVNSILAGRAASPIVLRESLSHPESLLNDALFVFELKHLEGLNPLISELPLSLPLGELFQQLV